MTRWPALVATLVVVVAAAVTTMVLSNDPAAAAEGESRFVDDDWSVHEPNINAIAAAGITLGCNPPANDRYCPTRHVTRGEIAALLVRSFGYNERGAKTFTDDDTSVFEADIERLAAAGITTGCNPPANTRYCPNDRLTRAQMATLLVRALDLAPRSNGPFVDTTASVHARDINAIAAAGVTKGCNPPTNNLYCPGDFVTRGQMASFLARALELTPIHNRIAMHTGSSCRRDATVCTATLSLPPGRGFNIVEGWHHATPFAAGEETEFRATGTRFEVTLDGRALATTPRESTAAGLATRQWSAEVRNLPAGTHTLRGTWRWNGATNLTVIVTLTVG